MNADQLVQDQPDVLPIDSVDQLFQVLTAWHGERCAVVQQLLEIPEGAEFQIGDEGAEKQTITLTGEALAGFKFGIEMTMMHLGTLPFVAEMVDTSTPAVPA